MDTLKGYIFDLDGTLYSFGGAEFSNSRLGTAIQKKYEKVLSNLGDSIPQETYKKMCTIERQTGVGVSTQFSQKLNISRDEVFKITWGELDPTMIIQDINYSQYVIPELSRKGKKLYLVTAAPMIWAITALEYLGLSNFFTNIYGLENFEKTKSEIFEQILRETQLEASNIISIGDQVQTDIIPAQQLGMQTLLIQRQEDLYKLLTL